VDIIDPPAAIRANEREARAVIVVIGASEKNFERNSPAAWLRRFRAHNACVKHAPMRDAQFMPGIKGDLPAVTRGKHVIGRAQLSTIEGAKLRANDFLRTAGEYSER
jgi:hypothetical protein